jgi:hypothetical protein
VPPPGGWQPQNAKFVVLQGRAAGRKLDSETKHDERDDLSTLIGAVNT